MIVRDFNNGFKVSDWTPELLVVPNQWGYLQNLGLFQEEGVATNTVQFEEITKDGALLVDLVRGQRASAGKDATRKVRSWAVPHFPYDDALTPQDIQGVRAYGSADQEETLAAARIRKLERIAQNHAWTLEYARSKLITTGDVYAPNGTVSMNFYTEFGITKKEIDFDMDNGATDVLSKVNEAVAHILTNASGEIVREVIALCSKTFFDRLIGHANVKAAYLYFSSTQDPLRTRVGGATAMHREFVYGGVRFIEMMDNYAGNDLIPSGDAYFIPVGTGIFKTYFSAASKFDLVGTLGERAYVFEYASPKGDMFELNSESNFINAVTRPAMIVRGYTG